MQRYLISTVFLLIGLLPTYGQGLPEEIIRYADRVFYNGLVLTMDSDDTNFSIHQAVALRDGRIIASGDDARILRMAGPNAMKIDLEGRTLMPGVIDTHSHPENYAKRHYQNDFRSELERLDLYKTAHISMLDWNDTAKALSKLKQAVDTAKPGQWVITNVAHEIEPGSVQNAKALRQEFDKLAPNNPLVLLQSTTHAVVNSLALEMLMEK